MKNIALHFQVHLLGEKDFIDSNFNKKLQTSEKL